MEQRLEFRVSRRLDTLCRMRTQSGDAMQWFSTPAWYCRTEMHSWRPRMNRTELQTMMKNVMAKRTYDFRASSALS